MSDEDMVQCPYNQSHVIRKARFGVHVLKCRRQHTAEKFETCPFNSSHDVPAPELQYHIQTCPDRKSLENYIYVMDELPTVNKSAFNVDLPPAPENWDEDTGFGSYLTVVEKKLETEKVFRQPVGLSKSERKQFFRNEVLKFGRGSGQNCQGDPSK